MWKDGDKFFLLFMYANRYVWLCHYDIRD